MSEPVVDPRAYARWRASELGSIVEQLEIEAVFDLAGDLRGRRVLDVGTGDGTYALEAARRGAEVEAVDPEPAMLDAARERAVEQHLTISLRRGRVESLPYPDRAFDVVFAVTVLCFLPQPDRALAEMARVLAPGGRLVLGELGRWSVWAAWRRVRGWLGARTWQRVRFWSRGRLVALIQAADLRVADSRGSIYFPPHALLARWARRLDPRLGRFVAPGAAFLVIAAEKPHERLQPTTSRRASPRSA